MPVMWQTVIRFTHYSTVSFINNFFFHTANQTLTLSTSITTADSAILYYMIEAQLFHQPQPVCNKAQSLPTSIITMAVWADTHGNKGVTQSYIQSHKWEVDSWLWELMFSQQCYWTLMFWDVYADLWHSTSQEDWPVNTYHIKLLMTSSYQLLLIHKQSSDLHNWQC